MLMKDNRVVARYVGSGIKSLKQGGIRDHILRIRDHGLGIGISAVVHRMRDQTDSVIMIKITKNLDFGFFKFFGFFASRTAYYMLFSAILRSGLSRSR